MKYSKCRALIIVLMFISLTGTLSFADQERDEKKTTYKVTITNLTRGQVFSPPIVIIHDRDFSLFTLGEAAGDELAALAERGDTGPLADLIYGIYPFEVAGGPVPPGGSESVILKVSKRDRLKLFSVAAMLVTTNDAFFAVRDMWFSGKGRSGFEATAYDAGSEENTEACVDIPGPPCAPPNNNPTEGAEGYVHVHAGIHGTGTEVNSADHDWNNPVAKVTIQRIYH